MVRRPGFCHLLRTPSARPTYLTLRARRGGLTPTGRQDLIATTPHSPEIRPSVGMVLWSIHAAAADNVGADGVFVEERKRPDDFDRRKSPVAPLAADPTRRV